MTWLPTRRLSVDPAISSREDLETAVSELAAINTREKNLDTELEKEVQHCKEQCAKLKRLKVGRSEMAFADRTKFLQDAVAAYCEEHREELLASEDGKTIGLTHGAISWRASRQSIGFAEGVTERDVIAKFESRKITSRILTLIDSVSWFGAKLVWFIKIKITLDKTTILKVIQNKSMPVKALEEAGLILTGGEDVLSIKLNDYPVKG